MSTDVEFRYHEFDTAIGKVLGDIRGQMKVGERTDSCAIGKQCRMTLQAGRP